MDSKQEFCTTDVLQSNEQNGEKSSHWVVPKIRVGLWMVIIVLGLVGSGQVVFAQDNTREDIVQKITLPPLPVGAAATSTQQEVEAEQTIFPELALNTNSEIHQSNANKPLLCRFSINGDIGNYDIGAFRAGWYIDYRVSISPSRPNGIQFAQVIRLHATNAPTMYTTTPKQATIVAALKANPGADWFIGNEPDRTKFQDAMSPEGYVKAYHDLYTLIKTNDPTARVLAGSIVQPTPVRLKYLDLILQTYQQQYNQPMPIDAWAIHNFILNEVDCASVNGDLNLCWGAEIPPGLSDTVGMTVTTGDNDNFTLFTQQIVRFRQWMKDRGYSNTPVYLSEYGVLMPSAFGFSTARVNRFMNKSFDYLLNTKDTNLGYAADDYRLIQRLSWYSVNDKSFNGYLYDKSTNALSAMGQNYISYTQALKEEADLYPVKFEISPSSPPTTTGTFTYTLKATIANSGNTLGQVASLRFFDGDPNAGGVQIGSNQLVVLDGCGDTATYQVEWAGSVTEVNGASTDANAHIFYIQLDSNNALNETNESNNGSARALFVETNRLYLPAIGKN